MKDTKYLNGEHQALVTSADCRRDYDLENLSGGLSHSDGDECVSSKGENVYSSSCFESISEFFAKYEHVIPVVKGTVSAILLSLCVIMAGCAIWNSVTPMSLAWHPPITGLIVIFLIWWLGILEGGQGSLVGLQPVDSKLYVETHPIAEKCARLAHEGNNLNRFIVGRQFFVVLVIFIVNLACTVVPGAHLPGFSPFLVELLLESGLAVMIITVIVGQLAAEVNATRSMLDFINTNTMYITTWLCLAIEASGLLHAVYLVPKIINWFAPSPSQTLHADPAEEGFFFWARMVFSCSILLGAMVVTLVALWESETTLCKDLPDLLSMMVFWFLVCFLGMMEAMQIALFAVVNLPRSEFLRQANATAQSNSRLAFKGNNFQSFLIGRQICVTISMFLLARITTTDVNPFAKHHVTVFGMPAGLQLFFNSGLPGALITTIVASLAWRIVASCFPVAFLGSPLVHPTIQLCLMLNTSGVFSASWGLADVLQVLMGLQPDTNYIKLEGVSDMHHQQDAELTVNSEDEISCTERTRSTTSSTNSLNYGSTTD